ncbi:hypothetical protein Pflav_049480 [Phytohabitans flavus]|uniref:Uncharacterized protein n=1 Tax=Phytohabitans flavus TaxID=1076124 RepID=A0A6F8XXS5_9ACTN|nr:hypothetical protein Pflav_049480 [Phytohabitans flavus]
MSYRDVRGGPDRCSRGLTLRARLRLPLLAAIAAIGLPKRAFGAASRSVGHLDAASATEMPAFRGGESRSWYGTAVIEPVAKLPDYSVCVEKHGCVRRWPPNGGQ